MSSGSARPPTPEAQVAFLQNLQRILDEGSFVATYKFALIHALADLAVERGDDSGSQLTLPTRDIAERFIRLYWRQVVPFPGAVEASVLRQNKGRPAVVVTRVKEARAAYGDDPGAMMGEVREWRRLVGEIDVNLRKMPLWRLQRVSDGVREFLYRQNEGAHRITLLPGVAACFRAFHPLVLDLVEGAWSHFIRRANAAVLGEQADLREFLFGSERQSLAAVRPILADLQEERCFYCGKRVREGDQHVDHFIPWWRYPTDLGHNFVLADSRCNGQKSDHLAGQQHLDHWADRNERLGNQLAREFDARQVRHDLQASLRIACWAYGQAAARSGQGWVSGKLLEPLQASWIELVCGSLSQS